MSLTIKIIIGVVIATLVGLVALKFIDSGSIMQTAQTTQEVTDGARNSIGITGYILNPGNYLLDDNATMGDLIEKAGGVTNKADSRAYFTDAILEKNVTYYIPPRYNPNDVCSVDEIQKVNINTYTDPEELTFIDGIGTNISKAIIDYRTSSGLFKTLETLMKVSGIGNATYTKLRNFVILADA